MDAPCRIRPVSAADLPAVHALERAVFRDPWSLHGLAAHLADHFLVAERSDRPVGYVVTRITADEAEILNVAVAPAVRRAGIGRALVRAALAGAAAAGARRVHLEVRASNDAALRLYTAVGFSPVGRRAGYYRNPPEDAVLLARNSPNALEGSEPRIFG